jgi:hypothetical protein
VDSLQSNLFFGSAPTVESMFEQRDQFLKLDGVLHSEVVQAETADPETGRIEFVVVFVIQCE